MSKKDSEQLAIELTVNLLYSCKRVGNWNPDSFPSQPLVNLLSKLSDHPDFKNIWDLELAKNILYYLLRDSPLKEKQSFTTSDAEKLLEDIHRSLVANVARHWIVVPLRKASLSKTVQFQDFVFIAGSREEKVETLRRLSQMPKKDAYYLAEHTENSRSPGFFEHPLLAIRIVHQTNYVEHLAPLYALWTICSLQAIYWGYIYPDGQSSKWVKWRNKCEHLAIWAKDAGRYWHQSLPFRSTCKFDLDWISKRSHQKRFTNLFRSVIAAPNRDEDELTYRFFKALRYFGKAIDTEENSEAFEGMGITLVYLMTLAEGILLNNDFEKRNKLTVLLPRLAKLPDHTLSECALAVDQAYRWRSEFVHANNDKFPDWDDYLSEGAATKNTRLVKRMVARLLSDAPKHIQKMDEEAERLAQANREPPKLSSLWFKSLSKLWKKTLGLPTEEAGDGL
jgi:hypothetical protein